MYIHMASYVKDNKETKDGGRDVCKVNNFATITKTVMITLKISNGKNTIFVFNPSSH